MTELKCRTIGVVHSPFKGPKNVPIQAVASTGTKGTVEIDPEYVEGLKDLEGFSHIILLYHFHLVNGCSLMVKPFLDDNIHGVFATRSPVDQTQSAYPRCGSEKLKTTSFTSKTWTSWMALHY